MQIIMDTKKVWSIVKGDETIPEKTVIRAVVEPDPSPGEGREPMLGSPEVNNQSEIDSFIEGKKLGASILLHGISDATMTDLMSYLHEPQIMWEKLEKKYNSATSSKILGILTSIMNLTPDKNVDVNNYLLKL